MPVFGHERSRPSSLRQNAQSIRRRRARLITQLTAAAVCMGLIGAEVALAADRYATSQSPHWRVGDVNPALSAACRKHRFNQIVDQRRFIAYLGNVGDGITGIAKKGWNLRDPDRQGVDHATYHFADDGLSTCRVYVAFDKTPSP
ncbi:MAG: hypothetical protein IPK66_06970 [Rhodospirillales bacterium]|nr:hypothetical protein [Rhodospirillales bacterium]